MASSRGNLQPRSQDGKMRDPEKEAVKFYIATKESLCIGNDFNSHRIGLGSRNGCRKVT